MLKVMEANLDKEEDIKAELNVFQNHSQHPNIVSFLGAFLYRDQQADDHLWIVMEVSQFTKSAAVHVATKTKQTRSLVSRCFSFWMPAGCHYNDFIIPALYNPPIKRGVSLGSEGIITFHMVVHVHMQAVIRIKFVWSNSHVDSTPPEY